jgi:hypothetical protein
VDRWLVYRFFVRAGPPLTSTADHRCRPDRRRTWRGGRRDVDWTRRPIGARRAIRLHQWLYACRRTLGRWIAESAFGFRSFFVKR